MSSYEPDSQDPKSSKTVKSILTASGKKSKNRRISWGGYNKQHIFTKEGHLYDLDVPMNELMISQLQGYAEEDDAQRGVFMDDNIVENKENLMINGTKQVIGDNGKNLMQSFTFYNSKPGENIQIFEQSKFQGAYPDTPKDSPVKFKISDTPLLKSLDSSKFMVDNEDDMFDETGNLRDPNKKGSDNNNNNNKSFGLDSSFMKDLFVRSNAQQNQATDIVTKEVQIVAEEKMKKNEPFQEIMKEKKKEFGNNPPQVAEDKSAKRLSFSVKNIINSKIPDMDSDLPSDSQQQQQQPIWNQNPVQSGMDENVDLKVQSSKTSLVARIFSQEDDGSQNKEKELPDINFTQEIDDEIKKSRRLSSTVHGILVENPPSSIKKVEQSNFSLEQDDFIDNLMRDKPLFNIFQEKDNAQPLTTSILLNQSFEDKLNKYLSPQKKGTTMNPNLQLSKSPLLSSPHYEIQSQKYQMEKEDEPEKRRLSLKMKLNESQSFIDDDEDWKDLTTPKAAEAKPLAIEEENQGQKQNLKYPYSTDLKPIPECSDSFGESDAKKSISSDKHGTSGAQDPTNILLQDPSRRISLKVSIADEDEESFRDDDDMPFIFEPEKKKVAGVNAKKVVETVAPAAAVMNEKKEVENKPKSNPNAMQLENPPKAQEVSKAQPQTSPGAQGKKPRSPYLKRKNRPTSTEATSELEDPKLKKTKLTTAAEANSNSGQKVQIEIKKSPFKLKGVLKNSKRSEVAAKPQVEDDKENEENKKLSKEVTIANTNETGIKQSQESKEVEEVSKDGEPQHQTKINSLIVKSPRINKLQKKFLIDFLSPRDSLSVNQSTADANNAYALLDRAPTFNQDQVLGTHFMKHTDDNKFNNTLKNSILLKCKSCYEYAQKVKLLKEQLHDLENNIDMLDDEIKKGEAELERKSDEVNTSEFASMFDEFGTALNYDKTQSALVENLQIALALFGFTVKTALTSDKGARYRIKFDNDIFGIATFEVKEENSESPEFYLNEFTLIDLQSNYRRSSKSTKILLGDELIYSREESKIEPMHAFSRKTVVDIVFNEMMKTFFRKKMPKVNSAFIYVSFRLRSYFYLMSTLKYLATSQILEKAIINYDSLTLKAAFRFRYMPRNIIFSLNLRKSWWNDFEVLWEGDEKFNQLLGDGGVQEVKGSKQEEKNMENRMWDSTRTKLMTLFNSEINKRTINKFENIVTDILSFKWVTI